jgi:hypothetical protein
MGELTFLRLNTDWNAEPNAPSLEVTAEESTVTLSFYLNPFAFEATENEVGRITFTACSRWRWDATNDEAWFAGKGRFSGDAPEWGQFYEIVGIDASLDDQDWEIIFPDRETGRHFLFYFRDEAIECVADDWVLSRG